MSLRHQINLRIALISFIILIFGGIVAIWQARNAVNKEIAASLNLTAQLIQLDFSKDQQSTVDVNTWLPRFVSLKETRHLRIHLQKSSGKTVRFSAENHSVNVSNIAPGWFGYLVTTRYPSIRQELVTAGGEHITLLIEADPSDEIDEAWKESRAFFIALSALSMLTFVAINLALNKAFKAIGVIVNGLKAVEQGEYEQKLPEFKTEEYGLIAKAINHLTDVQNIARKENSALTLHSLQIQEEERQRLAQELHDELGQSLTAIKVMTVNLQHNQADKLLITTDISQICDHLLTVVRSMMRQLHPLMLDELGLKATLEDLLNHWGTRHPELAIQLNCPDAVDVLSSTITIQIYRIVQECITNIIRHANASIATINLDIGATGLTLQVSDNGLGSEPETLASGFGLLGMRERIKSLGGHLSIQTQPEQGLTITAWIPLP